VIGLGCGDGKDEVRLTQCLLEHHKNHNLRLYLLDISQPLLLCGLSLRCRGRWPTAPVFPSARSRATSTTCSVTNRCFTHRSAPTDGDWSACSATPSPTFKTKSCSCVTVLLGFAPGDFLLLNVPSGDGSSGRRVRSDERSSVCRSSAYLGYVGAGSDVPRSAAPAHPEHQEHRDQVGARLCSVSGAGQLCRQPARHRQERSQAKPSSSRWSTSSATIKCARRHDAQEGMAARRALACMRKNTTPDSCCFTSGRSWPPTSVRNQRFSVTHRRLKLYHLIPAAITGLIKRA
jgi:hypothetical protein